MPMDWSAIPYVVEKMRYTDVAAVADLEKLVFTLPWSAHAFDYELRYNTMAHFLVVRQRGSLIATKCEAEISRESDRQGQQRETESEPVLGYGGFWFIVDEAHICTLAIHPRWRGRGLGELILLHLIDLGKQVGAAVATLEVRASNLVAHRLYQKYGFARVGLRKGYYSDNGEDALIMTTEPIASPAYQSRFQTLGARLGQRLVATSNNPPAGADQAGQPEAM
jgi:ribosomal-protein-alanine N-acetyltransferase